MKQIMLTDTKFAMVDDVDYYNIKYYKWWSIKSKQDTYYAQTKIDDKNIFMHQFIMNNILIDHINHNGLDNRRENLRIATNQQNSFNARKRLSPTSSKYKGVTFDKSRGKWLAQIKHNYNHIFLGRFYNEDEAALAYNEAAMQLFGEFAHLNELC